MCGGLESSPLALSSYPLRQGVSVKLVLHFSSLWGILGICPWRQGLQVGHHAQLAFTWVSEDLNSGSHVWVVLALISHFPSPKFLYLPYLKSLSAIIHSTQLLWQAALVPRLINRKETGWTAQGNLRKLLWLPFGLSKDVSQRYLEF